MRTKDIVINFCISVAAAICFEVMKYTVDVLKGLPINSFYIFRTINQEICWKLIN